MSHPKVRRIRIVPLAMAALTAVALAVVPTVLSSTATAATTTTFGFTGSYTGNNATPASLACS